MEKVATVCLYTDSDSSTESYCGTIVLSVSKKKCKIFGNAPKLKKLNQR